MSGIYHKQRVRVRGRMAGLSLLALFISGCGITEPLVVQADYGSSVRQMIGLQTLDPLVAANPNPEPVMGLDGVKAGAILETYRVKPPEAPTVQNIINIGTP